MTCGPGCRRFGYLGRLVPPQATTDTGTSTNERLQRGRGGLPSTNSGTLGRPGFFSSSGGDPAVHQYARCVESRPALVEGVARAGASRITSVLVPR